LAKARKQEPHTTYDGIYAFHIKGEKGEGAGILVLMAVGVFGSDQAGVSYDGEYQAGPQKGQIHLKLRITEPYLVPSCPCNLIP
jgi:hypothetical protein